MFFWSPLIAKFGRRPVCVVAMAMMTLCAVWAALATTYETALVARMGLGAFGGGAECLTPITITHLFFAHARGKYMSLYQVMLSTGVTLGIFLAGAIAKGTDKWRMIYWVGVALSAALTVLVVFTFPETAFHRAEVDRKHVFLSGEAPNSEKTSIKSETKADSVEVLIPEKKTHVQRLALYSGTCTHESLFKMFVRPFGLIFLPAVFFAALVFAIPVGLLVDISSNIAVVFGSPPYNFSAFQTGLIWLGPTIAGFLAYPVSGAFGDWVAARATHKNGGIREPEMRLPALFPCIIIGPLGMILYGVGIVHGLHWMCSTMGVSLLVFSLVAATNHGFVYAIDCYKPIAPEVVVAALGFKSIIGFGLSFGTNDWITLEGYQNAHIEMAAIAAGVFGLSIPFWLWGASFRKASFGWKLTSWIRWEADRDDLQVVLH